MSTNPYQSPQFADAPLVAHPPDRQAALKSLRIATVLLTTAGLFNVFAFHYTVVDFYIIVGAGPSFDPWEFAGASVATCLIAVTCWFLVLPTLEFLGRLIQEMVAPNVDSRQWHGVLYRSLKPAAILAGPGMILWVIWVFAFYYLKLNFYVISYAVGIPAHILAACLYVPLVVRWFRLWRGSRTRDESEAA